MSINWLLAWFLLIRWWFKTHHTLNGLGRTFGTFRITAVCVCVCLCVHVAVSVWETTRMMRGTALSVCPWFSFSSRWQVSCQSKCDPPVSPSMLSRSVSLSVCSSPHKLFLHLVFAFSSLSDSVILTWHFVPIYHYLSHPHPTSSSSSHFCLSSHSVSLSLILSLR